MRTRPSRLRRRRRIAAGALVARARGPAHGEDDAVGDRRPAVPRPSRPERVIAGTLQAHGLAELGEFENEAPRDENRQGARRVVGAIGALGLAGGMSAPFDLDLV